MGLHMPRPQHSQSHHSIDRLAVISATLLIVIVVATWQSIRTDQMVALDGSPCASSGSVPRGGVELLPIETSDPERTRAMLRGLRLVNYYPADNGWTRMWSDWSETRLDTDFDRIASLHANAVRVILHLQAFGYPNPSPTMTERLARTVELADRHGLKVEITLFDWAANYRDLTGSARWAAAVLSDYRDDPRIAFIELQNEMDPTNPEAIAWARQTLPCVRALVGHIPMSISVSGADPGGIPGLRRLVAAALPVDFYDLHYYERSALAYATFREALELTGPVPLFIGEAGYSTYVAPSSSGPASGTSLSQEAHQDQFHRTVQYAARLVGLAAPAPWILSDFARGAIPSVGTIPDPGQYYYGLFRADGAAKLSAATLEAIFAGVPVDKSFNNGFEWADEGGQPAIWSLWYPSYAAFARDTSVFRSGIASARISRSSGSPTGNPSFYASPVQSIESLRSYTATGWARTLDATGTTALVLGWFDRDGRYLESTTSQSLSGSTADWVQLQITALAPQNAAFVEIHLVSAFNQGTAWFDDVEFE
jgi:hypothetical protein